MASEAVADIVREMNCSHEGMIAFEFMSYADRIESAHSREVENLRFKLKVAEDALKKIFNMVFVDCEVAAIAKNALAASREEGGANA